jgi:hypothetical protein
MAIKNSKKMMQIFKFIFLKNNLDLSRQIYQEALELEPARLQVFL